MVIVGPQQGWQCPQCKNIYSPTTPMCYVCSNNNHKTVGNLGSVNVDFDPKITLTEVTTTHAYHTKHDVASTASVPNFLDNPLENTIKQSENFPY